ncbi:peptidylprolyl isomerase [Colwelliaceae bacterium 6441]
MTTTIMKKLITTVLLSLASSGFIAQATIVEFQTSHGNFKVNLHDETTPITVTNFLKYVEDFRYDNTIVHRTVDNFVIQGGGAKFEGTLPPKWIETDSNIMNEPVYSNVRATIAMAKSAYIHSATSQWFINTKDNSSSLDPYERGGFTVFGEVIEDGMNVVNAIANVNRCNTGYSGFTELPMPDYSAAQCANGVTPSTENFVTVYNVVIVDSTVNTDGDLASVKNTRYKEPSDNSSSKGSGGGSLGWYSLLLIALFGLFRHQK